MKPSAGRSLVMALAEGAEAAYDFLLENEAVKAVPVLATAVRLLEGADDIRSRLLQEKIIVFVSEPALARSAESGEMLSRIRDDSSYAESIGDTLFLTLDKLTDLKKPALLAQVFAYQLADNITKDELLMLMHAIGTSALVDLELFISLRGVSGQNETGYKARLASTGLLTGIVNAMVGASTLGYFVSPLGLHFLNAVAPEPQ